jgi:hypothetical protein
VYSNRAIVEGGGLISYAPLMCASGQSRHFPGCAALLFRNRPQARRVSGTSWQLFGSREQAVSQHHRYNKPKPALTQANALQNINSVETSL